MTIQEKYIELKLAKRKLNRETLIMSILSEITGGKWVNYPTEETNKMIEKIKTITNFADARDWVKNFQSKHQHETKKEFENWLNK